MQSRIIFLLLFVFSLPVLSQAQQERSERRKERREKISETLRMQEEGVITQRKSFLFGPKLTTDGYGAFIEIGRAKSIEKALLFQLEITERKHRKEEKSPPAYLYGTPYIYGKINYFYPVKLGVQQQILLGNKSNKNGVAVTANFGGGVTAGLLRPYYVQIEDDFGQLKYVRYESNEQNKFLDKTVILNGPSLNKGWSDMTVAPGVYAKTAFRFDYGRFNEIITGVEVGLTGEYYFSKVPQLAFVDEKQFFFGGYFALLFGKRK